MFIMATLIVMLVILTAFIITGLAAAGAGFIIIFGDVLVAMGVIGFLIWVCVKKRLEK